MVYGTEDDNPGWIKEVIIGALVLILTGLIFFMISSSVLDAESFSAISTLIAAFLGASVAGIMAIKVAKEQNKVSLKIAKEQNDFIREHQQNLENSKTLKTIMHILGFTTIYYEKMITINEILRNESRFDEDDLFEKLDKIFNTINEQYLSFFNQIDWSTINKEEFYSIGIMREIGNSIIEDYYIYKEIEKLNPTEIATRWNEKLVELKQLIEKVNDKYKDQLLK